MAMANPKPIPNTFLVPYDLPQTHLLDRKEIYVRYCYRLYYSHLIQRLESQVCYINLTGTPGIGKSVFYQYFFSCYISDFPDRDIVLAAFTKDKKLKECMYWHSQTKTLKPMESVPRTDRKRKVLWLYDGIPGTLPLESDDMICFASPEKDFMKDMSKFTIFYTEVFMPNWTFKEQQSARDTLDLKIDDSALRNCWNFFGGTVRDTFLDTATPDGATSQKRGFNHMSDAIQNLTNMEEIDKCFSGNLDTSKVVHRILHYDVEKIDDISQKLKPASKWIAFKMKEKVQDELKTERDKLIGWLDGAGKAGTFVSWLYENLAHEKLLEGFTGELRSLDGSGTEHFAISQTHGEYTRFKVDSMQRFFTDAYRMPDASNLRPVDSYYVAQDSLWLFQITVNIDHDISIEGLIQLLVELKWLGKFSANPASVKL